MKVISAVISGPTTLRDLFTLHQPPRHRQHRRRPAALRAIAALGSATALFGSTVTWGSELPLWELGAGAGTLRLPHYRGSDQVHHWLLPIPFLVYRGHIFRADREGTRAVLLDTERVEIDLSLEGSAPTRSADNRARSGMPDLAATLQFGPKLNLALGHGEAWKLELRLPVRAAFAADARPRSLGWTFAPVLNFDLRLQGWNVGLSGGPQVAGRRFNGYFYDVAPADATAQRPAYAARSGFGGWDLTASASRRIGDWWLAAYARHESVAAATFRSSPLVRQGSNVSAGLALSRVFLVSDERVTERP